MQHAPENLIPSTITANNTWFQQDVVRSGYLQLPGYPPFRDAPNETNIESKEPPNESTVLSEPVPSHSNTLPDVTEFEQIIQR